MCNSIRARDSMALAMAGVVLRTSMGNRLRASGMAYESLLSSSCKGGTC